MYDEIFREQALFSGCHLKSEKDQYLSQDKCNGQDYVNKNQRTKTVIF